MKRINTLLFAAPPLLAAMLAFAPSPLPAGPWGAGGCPSGGYPTGPVGSFSFPVYSAPVYSAPTVTRTLAWREFARPDAGALWLAESPGDFCRGVWRYDEQRYYPYDAASQEYGPACAPPVAPPAAKHAAKAGNGRCGCKGVTCGCEPGKCRCDQSTGSACSDCCPCVAAEPVPNFGMDYHPTHDGPHYFRSGERVSREQVLEALAEPPAETVGDGKVPDDSARPWLVVIGDKIEVDSVVFGVQTDARLKQLLNGYRLKRAARDSWWVKQRGLDATGHPTIYRLAADGKYDPARDVWRSYQGAEWFADELSKVLPPAPDARKPAPNTPPDPAADYGPHACCAGLGAAMVAAALYLRKRGSP